MSETSTRAPGLPAPALRSAVRSPGVLLGLMVVLGALVRTALASGRDYPRYLPDEYLYPELARSLASGDGSSILGQHASFPALLEPLLIAPLWGALSPAAAIQATQALHATLLAAAAIPVYAIARQLSLSTRASLICAAATLLVPGAFFAGLLTADALGMLLALTAIAVGMRALTTPSLRAQVGFLAIAGLTVTARSQYAVLLPAYAIAAVVVERRPVRALRAQPLVVGLIAIGLVAAPLVLPRVAGRYEEATTFGLTGESLSWAAQGGFLLLLATGLVVAPGALAWIGSSLVRPSGRPQAALAGLTAVTVTLLLLAASVMTVETASDRFMERYLVVAAPLVVVAFAAWMADGRPARRLAMAGGLGLVLAAAQLPLSQWTGGQGVADSPTLLGLSWLEPSFGVANASLVAASVITLGGLVAALVAWRPQLTWIAATAAGALFAAVALGAHARDAEASEAFRDGMLTRSPSWIDERGEGDALLVQTRDSTRFDAMLTILMNDSIDRAARLGDEEAVDDFDGVAPGSLTVARDGRLLDRGAPVRGPVVWAIGGTASAFDDVREVAYDDRFALVLPRDVVRVAMTAEGVRYDGSVSPDGVLSVYPTADGRCTRLDITLREPPGIPATVLRTRSERGGVERVVVRADRPVRLSLTSFADAPRRLRWETTSLGGRAPTAFDVTVALATYRTRTVPCEAQGNAS